MPKYHFEWEQDEEISEDDLGVIQDEMEDILRQRDFTPRMMALEEQ
jgi:hypothetical protein